MGGAPGVPPLDQPLLTTGKTTRTIDLPEMELAEKNLLIRDRQLGFFSHDFYSIRSV